MSLLLVSTLRIKTLRNVFFVLLLAVKVVNKDVRHNSVFTFLKIRDDFKEIRGTRFSHKATVSARKPASFWREKRDTVFILVRGFSENVVLSKQVKNTVAVFAFFDQQKWSVTRQQYE